MGNSQGVIIPKLLLDEIGVTAGDTVSLKINKKGKLVMSPVRVVARAGWSNDSKTLAQSGEAKLVWSDIAIAVGRGPKW